MTPVNSAVKMVGQLRRWLTGDELSTDDHRSVENVSGHCSSCSCKSVTDSELQYRGRSYSDCFAASRLGGQRGVDVRERSCSVSVGETTSRGLRRLGPQTHQTVSGSSWSSGRPCETLEEGQELCHCWSRSVEPVCCCERCFVYIDERPLLPPPYSDLVCIEHCAGLTDTELVMTVNTADETDQTAIVVDDRANSESGQISVGQPGDMVSEMFQTSLLWKIGLYVSVHRITQNIPIRFGRNYSCR